MGKGKPKALLGASCVPLFTGKASANAPRITCRNEATRKTTKRASCLSLIIEVNCAGKVRLGEVDFANNHGTMPPSVETGFPFESCW